MSQLHDGIYTVSQDYRAPDARAEALAVLDSLSSLKAGWDLELAKPVTSAAIESARMVISAINKRYDVFPLTNGGVLLELQGARGFIQAEVQPDGIIEYTLYEGAEENRYIEGIADVATLTGFALGSPTVK